MTIPTLFRAWPAAALALSLCACAGDPDLPRSYGQPGLFAPRETRRSAAPVAPPQTASTQTAPVAEARDAAAAVPAQPAYSPPAPPPRAYTPPTLAGGPSEASPARYVPPPYRPELVPGYVAPQAAPAPAPVQARVPAPVARQPVYAPPPERIAPPPPRAVAALPPSPPPQAASNPRYGVWRDDDYRYRIGPGDELALRFLFNPEQNGQVIVGPDGRGVFPLVSSQKVADLTADQANAALTQAYGAIFRKPDVEVLITAYGSSQIYVGGEVREPGVHPIKGQLTTAQAVLTAGGLLPTARTGRVVVLRQRPDGQLLMKEVDLKAYLYKGRGETDFAILPGDLIFVPRSKIAEVDLFVEQYINGVLPFSRSVGYNLNGNQRY